MRFLSFICSIRVGALGLLTALISCGALRPDPWAAPYASHHPALSSSSSAPFDRVAPILGLPDLSTVSVSPRARELRMGSSFSMFGSAFALRVLERPGRLPVGGLVPFWREWRIDSAQAIPRARCTTWADSARTCLLVWSRAFNWPAIAAHLDSLGAWSLSERCEAEPFSVADAGDLQLQRLRGSYADSYSCNAPAYRHSPAARRASMLLNYLDSLASVTQSVKPDAPP
jgi:hypothetical protein